MLEKLKMNESRIKFAGNGEVGVFVYYQGFSVYDVTSLSLKS